MALNHPAILAVHQFGRFDGSPYLGSELLDGSTLRQLSQLAAVERLCEPEAQAEMSRAEMQVVDDSRIGGEGIAKLGVDSIECVSRSGGRLSSRIV